MRGKVEVRARCPWCGPLVVGGELFRCQVEPGRPALGLCELTCPSCSGTVLLPMSAAAIEAVTHGGGQHLTGPVPFELLEPHSGGALSWDDLLDFKLALDRSRWPQVELKA